MNTNGVFSKKSDEWSTPEDLFYKLNIQFHFTLDPCCTHENAKCIKHYTINENGLLQSWENEIVFCNPPYSNVYEWLQKAMKEKALTVCLLPSRTGTKWFHECVLNGSSYFRFLRGRLKFGNSKNSAPFDSLLVVYDNLQLLKCE